MKRSADGKQKSGRREGTTQKKSCPAPPKVLFVVDSASRALQMSLDEHCFELLREWIEPSSKRFVGLEPGAVQPPPDFYGSIQSLGLGRKPDVPLLPGFDPSSGAPVPYGPLLFLVHTLGKFLGLQTVDEIKSHIAVITTDALDGVVDEGKGVEAVEKCLAEWHDRHHPPILVLYGPAAAASAMKFAGPIYSAGVDTFPPIQFFRRVAMFDVQADLLCKTQAAFDGTLEQSAGDCPAENTTGAEVRFGSYPVGPIEKNADRTWASVLLECDPLKSYVRFLSGAKDASSEFEVIVSLWNKGLLKHIVLKVSVNNPGLDDPGLEPARTISVTVAKLGYSDNIGKPCELEEFQCLPQDADDFLVHLFDPQRIDNSHTFAHVTYISQRQKHNSTPRLFSSSVDGDPICEKFSPAADLRSMLERNVPAFLEKKCPAASPYPFNEQILRGHYVVEATFRIMQRGRGRKTRQFFPIAIGEAPVIVPCPNKPDTVHLEVARTMHSMIQRTFYGRGFERRRPGNTF